MRETANRPDRGGREARELLRDPTWWPMGVGVTRSLPKPKASRATVDVKATIETWRAALVGVELGESRVPIMVPRFVRKVSPGPAFHDQILFPPIHVISLCYAA